MKPLSLSQPDRAFLGGRVADCDHQVEVCAAKFIRKLRAPRMLDADFGQRRQRLGVDIARWLSSRADRFPLVAQAGIDDGFRNLRTARVTGSKKQHFTLAHGLHSSPLLLPFQTNPGNYPRFSHREQWYKAHGMGFCPFLLPVCQISRGFGWHGIE